MKKFSSARPPSFLPSFARSCCCRCSLCILHLYCVQLPYSVACPSCSVVTESVGQRVYRDRLKGCETRPYAQRRVTQPRKSLLADLCRRLCARRILPLEFLLPRQRFLDSILGSFFPVMNGQDTDATATVPLQLYLLFHGMCMSSNPVYEPINLGITFPFSSERKR